MRGPGGGDDAAGTEVRITAQRLADGRTEFALQERDVDGGWGERLLPRGRFFPARATVGRWLSSTPLTVSVPGADDDAAGTEVRITAQRLADGRTEFALQERDVDGGWGERLLTGERFFPATATVGRWLSSTPLTVSLPEPQVSEDTSDDGSVASDRAALVALYNATGGASWITSTNWLSDRPLDEWHGVTTNSDGRVAGLELIRNELAGPIPAGLGDLTNLEGLLLGINQLTGPIPTELGALTILESLWLGGNRLAGPIPAELGALTNLEELSLAGPIPAELGALTNLKALSLWGNELTGPIPAWLGGLTNLALLNLRYNRLSGPSPTELGALTNLELLILHRNELSGAIPAELGALTNLESLRLSDNQLTGCVPVGLRDVASNDLGELALPDCGEVSPDTAEDGGSVASDRAALVALYNATGGASWTTSTKWLTDRPLNEWHGVTTNSDGRVAELKLFTNELTGPIPAELGELTDLRALSLSFNELSGPIPAELGGLTNLEALWLGGNQLTGPIPAELGSLRNLRDLSLFKNELTGPIPTELGGLTKLYSLVLAHNELRGPIPTELGALISLESLELLGNQLTGCVPAGLRDVVSNDLGELDLPDCSEVSPDVAEDVGSVASDRAALVAFYNATGGASWDDNANWLRDRPIGEWYGVTTNGAGRVAKLDLYNNNLRGPIPAELVALTKLQRLVLAYNQLTGPIAAKLGSLRALRGLLLSGNQLTGPIPVELGALTKLQSLGLSGNELTGPIPSELGDLTNLQVLNLDSNQLTGSIPTELGDLTNLEVLGFYNNQLTGSIPAELGTLTNLKWLWLSGNELTGCVPVGLREVATNDFGELGLPDCG